MLATSSRAAVAGSVVRCRSLAFSHCCVQRYPLLSACQSHRLKVFYPYCPLRFGAGQLHGTNPDSACTATKGHGFLAARAAAAAAAQVRYDQAAISMPPSEAKLRMATVQVGA